MKKNLLVVFVCLSFISFAQQSDDASPQEHMGQNELKINMTNLIAFKFADLTYERILNEESSIGASLLVSLGEGDNDGLDEYRTFSFTPYYRHFFSKKYAKGFFVEAFGMLHSGEERDYIFDDVPPFENEIVNKYTDFAIGISAGGKFVTKRGFIAEIYLGLGRDLLGESDVELVGRGGISLGYRF